MSRIIDGHICDLTVASRQQRVECKSAQKSRHVPHWRMHVCFSLKISQGSRRVQGSTVWCDVRSNYPVSPQAHYSDSAGRRRRVVKMPRGEPLLFQQHVHCPPQEFDETFEKGTLASISRLAAGCAFCRCLCQEQDFLTS